jgi:hypothetical protein
MPGPWGDRGKATLLAAGATWSPGSRRESESRVRGSLPRTDVLLDLAHEAVPGRWSASWALRKAPSRLRRALGFARADEGWGLYAERLAVEAGLAADDPRVEIAWRARESRALARAAGALETMLGYAAADPDGPGHGDALRDALIEARARASMEPADLDPVITLWRWLDLRAAVRLRAGPDARLDRLHELVLRMGGPLTPAIEQAALGRFDTKH